MWFLSEMCRCKCTGPCRDDIVGLLVRSYIYGDDSLDNILISTFSLLAHNLRETAMFLWLFATKQVNHSSSFYVLYYFALLDVQRVMFIANNVCAKWAPHGT